MTPTALRSLLLLALALAEARAWTIDLPEARKYFFEKHDDRKKQEAIKYTNEMKFFDNIEPDSPHNRDEHIYTHERGDEHDHERSDGHGRELENDVYGGKYAEEYEHLSYMEKKVHGIVYNGSVYLEGLRRALEDYGEVLKNCSSLNRTMTSERLLQSQPPNGTWLPENMPLNISSSMPGSTANRTGPMGMGNQTGLQSILNGPPNETDYERCARATQHSEQVRRLAELALWATRELQDRAYEQKYGQHTHDAEAEEAELLVRLAFFLDRLADYTGYDPQAQHYIANITQERAPSNTPAPFSVMGDIPEDVKTLMMDCLDSNSTEPATDRCRYPLDHPDFIKRLYNMTDAPTTERTNFPNMLKDTMRDPPMSAMNARSKRDVSSSSKSVKDQGGVERGRRGLLIDALISQRLAHKVLDGVHEEIHPEHHRDFHHKRRLFFDKLAILKNTHKKLVELVTSIKHHRLEEHEQEYREKRQVADRRKRSVETPILHFMKYFVKHKVWANSNQENLGDIDVANHLSEVKVVTDEYDMANARTDTAKIQKRSIDNKKYKHMKLPENPYQDLSNYVKHKQGVNYITDPNQKQKLSKYLDELHQGKSSTTKKFVQKLLKRQKRSIHFERKFQPSRPQDPSRDISYYVKNKEGTEYRLNSVQQAQVRSNLETAFQNPNIEIVRRYGANINPAIPNPLAFGMAETFFSDNL